MININSAFFKSDAPSELLFRYKGDFVTYKCDVYKNQSTKTFTINGMMLFINVHITEKTVTASRWFCGKKISLTFHFNQIMQS